MPDDHHPKAFAIRRAAAVTTERTAVVRHEDEGLDRSPDGIKASGTSARMMVETSLVIGFG